MVSIVKFEFLGYNGKNAIFVPQHLSSDLQSLDIFSGTLKAFFQTHSENWDIKAQSHFRRGEIC